MGQRRLDHLWEVTERCEEGMSFLLLLDWTCKLRQSLRDLKAHLLRLLYSVRQQVVVLRNLLLPFSPYCNGINLLYATRFRVDLVLAPSGRF